MTMKANAIPEVINHFNVYNDSDKSSKLVGRSGEVTLPDLDAITETIEGGGVLGEVEDPITGHFGSIKMTIPFTNLYVPISKLMNTTKAVQLTLRGSMQCMQPDTAETGYYPIKVVVKGKASSTKLGKLENGKKMEPEVELEILYIKVVIDGTTVIELDKLNFTYILNGKDMLAEIKKQI